MNVISCYREIKKKKKETKKEGRKAKVLQQNLMFITPHSDLRSSLNYPTCVY